MQEIFNKVEQNQLQRTKNVVYFLDAGKNTFDFRTLATEPKWVVGHHPLVNSGGGWSCHKCQRERLRGITDFLQSFSWYFHRAWDRSRLPEIMSCFPNIPREGRVFFLSFTFQERSDEMKKLFDRLDFWLSVYLSNLFFEFPSSTSRIPRGNKR